jgi:uracil-DNA glycosylase family 4
VPDSLSILNQEIISCTRCERLINHCQKVGREKRRAYMEWEYWAKPVPGFGDKNARVLLLGLAPGAHGSNRTGRPFTGDGSGNFLFPTLFKTGFASQPTAIRVGDGLKLHDAYITSVVRCAPPGNKPTNEEIATCSAFVDRELELLKRVKVVVALGKIGFDGYLGYLRRKKLIASRSAYPFGHAQRYSMPNGKWLLASYHPSLQNTLTGKLTEKMFVEIFRTARKLAEK